jgi:choline dehydrogenase-like flavoprotein
MCLLFNPESRGSVTLRSADPEEAPLLDPRFLTNRFDRRVIVEGVREMMRVLSAPVYAADTIERLGPAEDSDESISASPALIAVSSRIADGFMLGIRTAEPI